MKVLECLKTDTRAANNYGDLRGCIQKFPDLPLGARTAYYPALCH